MLCSEGLRSFPASRIQSSRCRALPHGLFRPPCPGGSLDPPGCLARAAGSCPPTSSRVKAEESLHHFFHGGWEESGPGQTRMALIETLSPRLQPFARDSPGFPQKTMWFELSFDGAELASMGMGSDRVGHSSARETREADRRRSQGSLVDFSGSRDRPANGAGAAHWARSWLVSLEIPQPLPHQKHPAVAGGRRSRARRCRCLRIGKGV